MLSRKGDNEESLNLSEKNTIIHVIGHSLGLSHPKGHPFNLEWNTGNTVMSYNKGLVDRGTCYSDLDLDALNKYFGKGVV